MAQYEMTLLFRPDLTKTARTKLVKEIEELIKKGEGEVVKKDEWGKKALAYPIDNLSEAVYYQLIFEGPGKLPRSLSDYISLKEEVVRELMIKREREEEKRTKGGKGKKPD